MRRLKTAQAETCLSWLEKEGLKPVEVKTVNKLTKEEVNISLCPVAEEFNMMKQPSEEQLDILNITVYVKDN